MDRLYFGLLILLLLSFSSSHAATETVNLLSWWGYVDKNSAKAIESKCNIKFSVDEYYSNSEFLRRWDNKRNSHDLVIYSNTIHGFVQPLINKRQSSKIKKVKYPEPFGSQVSKLHLPNTTRVFLISLTGFLWNSKKFNLSSEMAISEIFKLVNGKNILILDDSVEGMDFVTKVQNASIKLESLPSNFFIANDKTNLISSPDFGFAYMWSGSAFEHMTENKELKFIVHPQLTHLTADLISVVSDSRGAKCAFDHLSSEKFLTELQGKTYFFSPFGKLDSRESKFGEFYKLHINSIGNSDWLKVPGREAFVGLLNEWKKVKLRLRKK